MPNKISIRNNERAFITGITGSGKTVFAKHLLRNITRLIVIDTKGELDDWNTEDFDAFTEHAIKFGDKVRVRVVPPLRADSEDFFDHIFFLAYEAGNIIVYIDEAYGVVQPGSKPMYGLTAIYTRGRSRDVGVIAASQRPAWTPLFMMSEAQHIVVFRLNMAEDRDRIAGIAGQPQIATPIRDQHGFYHYKSGEDAPTYVRRLELHNSSKRKELA